MLNVDWFRPFEYTLHSVGVIYYLTILNIPRRLRNRFPYILIIGVIPGPMNPVELSTPSLVLRLVNFWKCGRVVGLVVASFASTFVQLCYVSAVTYQ